MLVEKSYVPSPYAIKVILDGANKWGVDSCAIIRNAAPPVYPSDHYPVTAELALSE